MKRNPWTDLRFALSEATAALDEAMTFQTLVDDEGLRRGIRRLLDDAQAAADDAARKEAAARAAAEGVARTPAD